jgi:hypothetical protein
MIIARIIWALWAESFGQAQSDEENKERRGG